MTIGRMLVVRHGESTWNAVRRWQGQADPPLSDRGESQARRGALAAPEHGSFDAIVTSTLQRAYRTGELIASALDVPLLNPVSELSERSAGEWEGLTRAEIEQSFPGYLDEDRRPVGYESDASIVTRSSRALQRLAADQASRTLLVISHGGIIHALERAHSDDDGWRRLDNLTGRWFDVTPTRILPIGNRIALVPDGGPAIPPPETGYA